MHFILKESLDKGLSKFLRHLMQAWKSNLEVYVKRIRVILCNVQKLFLSLSKSKSTAQKYICI